MNKIDAINRLHCSYKMPPNYRFKSETEEALGKYILECGKESDIEDLSFTKTNTQISILLYDDGLVFSIDKMGKVIFHDDGVSNNSDWKHPVDMANFLQNYIEEFQS